MAVESAADRAMFVNADEFGVTAVYTPFGGAASEPFSGQFDDPSIAATPFGQVATIDARPSFFCAEADLPDGAAGDASDQLAIVGGRTLQVLSIEPDGTGMVLLRLGAVV